MAEEPVPPEPPRDEQPRRPQRIRGAVLRKSREELEARGVVIP